jgi:hypothetical protein
MLRLKDLYGVAVGGRRSRELIIEALDVVFGMILVVIGSSHTSAQIAPYLAPGTGPGPMGGCAMLVWRKHR